MSILVLPLPPRQRLSGRAAGEPARAAPLAEVDYVFTPDGRVVGASGRAPLAALPRADRVWLVLADADVGWHRIEIPKAPPARLRAALAGAMEELLLDDVDALHFALGPGAVPGQGGWVAVTHRGWLQGVLSQIEAAGLEVENVVASSRPRDPGSGHFFATEPGSAPVLVLERRDGVASVSTEGALARALLPADGEGVRYTATAAAAEAAERWLGAPVAVLSEAERALAACRNPVNLRQFDLVPRHRGVRQLRDSWRHFMGPAWRPARVGLLALLAVQLVGLNAYAWQQQRTLQAKREQMSQLLRSSFPGVRSVLDAPLQMQREVDRVRAAAGRAGAADFEVLLGAAAAAWPDGAGPSATLRYEGQRLTLAAPGWAEPQVRQFSERLLGAGYSAEFADGRVTVGPLAAGAVRPAGMPTAAKGGA